MLSVETVENIFLLAWQFVCLFFQKRMALLKNDLK